MSTEVAGPLLVCTQLMASYGQGHSRSRKHFTHNITAAIAHSRLEIDVYFLTYCSYVADS